MITASFYSMTEKEGIDKMSSFSFSVTVYAGYVMIYSICSVTSASRIMATSILQKNKIDLVYNASLNREALFFCLPLPHFLSTVSSGATHIYYPNIRKEKKRMYSGSGTENGGNTGSFFMISRRESMSKMKKASTILAALSSAVAASKAVLSLIKSVIILMPK